MFGAQTVFCLLGLVINCLTRCRHQVARGCIATERLIGILVSSAENLRAQRCFVCKVAEIEALITNWTHKFVLMFYSNSTKQNNNLGTTLNIEELFQHVNKKPAIYSLLHTLRLCYI